MIGYVKYFTNDLRKRHHKFSEVRFRMDGHTGLTSLLYLCIRLAILLLVVFFFQQLVSKTDLPWR